MKIGFVQMAPVLGDRDATIRRIDGLIHQGKVADILVLPELCNSGYNFTDYQQAWNASETIDQSIFIQYLVSICRDYNLHIVSGFNERDGGRLYNTAVLVGPGGYLGKYRKLHLFMNEKDYFEPGNVGLPIFSVGSCRVGLLVCFDWIFPEVWRILALKGADLVCHPSNLVLPGLAQKAIPVHALLNRIHIVTANRVGSEGDLVFTGLSTIADDGGNVLIQATEAREEVGIVNVNPELARNKRVTPRNDIFGDRRPDQYRYLIDSV